MQKEKGGWTLKFMTRSLIIYKMEEILQEAGRVEWARTCET